MPPPLHRLLRTPPVAVGVALSLGIVAAAGLVLAGMGQPMFCGCGVVAVWSGDIWSSQNSQQVADPYTFTHIVHGVLFFWALLPLARWVAIAWRLVIATLVEVAWEITENTDAVIERYREATISLDYFGDSILNSTFDVLFCLLGFAIAARLPGRLAAAGVVITEAALMLTVRDSLLLNVVMLLFPNDAIRAWQLAR